MYDAALVDDLDRLWSEWGRAHALPEELEIQAPGGRLGAMLAGVGDRSVLDDSDLVMLARARGRQIAHLQAQLMADLVAIAGRCVPRVSQPLPGSGRRAEPVDHAVDEIAAAMAWTSTAAVGQLDLAERLVGGLPQVHAAMLAGAVDWPKAKLLADAVTGLDPKVADEVLNRVLPDAAVRTTGQLRARVYRLVMKADPEAARRRYRHGLKGRRVEHGREDDGTARLAGRWLPAARAAAANSRIQAIADWVKDGGDGRTVDQIRADVLLDLLQGLAVPGPDGQSGRPVPGDVARSGVEDHPDHDINGDDIDGDDIDGEGNGGGSRFGTVPRRTVNAAQFVHDRRRDLAGLADADPDFTDLTWPDVGDALPDEPDPPDEHDPPDGADPGGATDPITPADDVTAPAEPGPTQPRAPGRSDQASGQAGPPAGSKGGRRGRRRVGPRGVCGECGQSKLTRGLELTAPVTTLLGLAEHPGQLGSWGPVIAEVTRALVADLIHAPWRISLIDDGGRVVWNGPVRSRPDPGERRRFATATQAAYVRARDRRCRFPGCRRPASRSELDHTIPHTHDGPTHECNLCCLCVRHHVVKTAGLWKPEQLPDGRIIWRSPLGRVYVTHPEIVEEPGPVDEPEIFEEPPDQRLHQTT